MGHHSAVDTWATTDSRTLFDGRIIAWTPSIIRLQGAIYLVFSARRTTRIWNHTLWEPHAQRAVVREKRGIPWVPENTVLNKTLQATELLSGKILIRGHFRYNTKC